MEEMLRREWRSVVNTFIVTPVFIGFGLWTFYVQQGWLLYISCAVLGAIYPFLIFYDFMNVDRERYSSALPPDPIQDMRNRSMFTGYLWFMRILLTLTMLVLGYVEAYQDRTWMLYTVAGILFGLVNAWFTERFHYQWRHDRDVAKTVSAWNADHHAYDKDRAISLEKDLERIRREIESMERALKTYDEQLSVQDLHEEYRRRLELNRQITRDLLGLQHQHMAERKRANY